MKIESVRFHDTHKTFAASFDDGMTIILDSSLQYHNMLSVGLSSYFLTKGKWPTPNNINKRVTASAQWILKNKNRYKKWQYDGDHHTIEE